MAGLRSAVRRLALVLVGLGFGFILVEILARATLAAGLFPPGSRLLFQHVAWPLGGTPVLFHKDPEFDIRLVPGLKEERYFFADGSYTVSTVSLGYQDMGFRGTHELDGRPYVVALGDSHTFCTTVDDDQCWVSLLERMVHRPIANMALPGTGSVSHERVLRRYALPLKPQLILWQFTTNDPLDDYRLLRQDSSDTMVKRFKQWMYYHSMLYNILILVRQATDAFALGSGSLSQTVYSTSDVRVVLTRENYSRADLWNTEYLAGWQLTEEALSRAQAETKDAGAKLVVVLLPYKEEVYLEAAQRSFPDVRMLPLEEQASGRLTRFLEANHILYVDTTPELRRLAREGAQLYQVTDVHLNPYGNEAVARIVHEYLASRGLLDSAG